MKTSQRRDIHGLDVSRRAWLDAFGTFELDRATLEPRYHAHNAAVAKYFEGRPDDLLVLDLERGTSHWQRLATFLGCPVPPGDFPRLNVATPVDWFRLNHPNKVRS